MEDEKKNLLQALLRTTQSFCEDRLSVFLDQLSFKSAPPQNVPAEADALTLVPLPQTAHAEFIAAFKSSIDLTFVDFQDLLEYDAGLLEFTATTHDAVMGDLAMPAMLDHAEQRSATLLASLNQRLSTLADCAIGIENNPLAPVHFALALESAAQNLAWNLHTRVVALKVFDAEFLHHLDVLYASIDSRLNVSFESLTAAESHHAAPAEMTGESSQATSQVAVVVSEMPPAGIDLADSQPIATAAASAAADGMAIQPADYVNRLFSEFLDKGALSEQMVNLFGDLYLPYVQLAAADVTFIDAAEHPAKHLLHGLAKACKIHQENADDLQKSALVLEMKAVVRRVAEAGEPSRETFADAAFRFSASLRQHERQVAKRAKSRRLQQSGLRHLDGWKQHVSHVIGSKLTQYPQPVPEAARLFLTGPWMNYMADQYLNAATHNVQPTQTLALVDEILAYVAPLSADDVLEFTVIGTPVRQSLVAYAVDEKEIRQFLLQLMHFHRLALRRLQNNVALAE